MKIARIPLFRENFPQPSLKDDFDYALHAFKKDLNGFKEDFRTFSQKFSRKDSSTMCAV